MASRGRVVSWTIVSLEEKVTTYASKSPAGCFHDNQKLVPLLSAVTLETAEGAEKEQSVTSAP